ncbi:Golgi-associated plant pathogenesis-related protein 1 [Plakobranchus ocellatus]|uniref:Golgi-associated plant pathogenesis-related protein 1 n=1 Tax=Plakobranchus ocellatus TaxID=259542 RepID=A0AAV4DZQ8_9GAST|nr:Golgi-associated plant pathogenesis-related protein 1 [Plakobranchus ocellatus]
MKIAAAAVIFCMGLAIGLADTGCTKDENDACKGISLYTEDHNGDRHCCFAGYNGISTKTSVTNGVTVFTCTCKGSGSTGGSSASPKDPQIAAPAPLELTPLDEYRQNSLEKHNELRALHGSPPLVLSDELNSYAQAWAEHLAANNIFGHSAAVLPSGQKIGENIAYYSSSAGADYKGPEPVQLWYDEIKDYDLKTHTSTGVTGHFTQVVWKASTQLGVGKARTADGMSVFAVANYWPPGNYNNEYPENVPDLV